MKQWLCALAVCGCGLFGAQSAELRQQPILAQEAGSPVSVGLGGPAMTFVGLASGNILSASWGDLQSGCLVPETGAFANLLSFVRGAKIRAQAAREKELLLRAGSMLVVMLLLGLTVAICLEPERRRILDLR